jgi:hypothetical protein
VDRLQVYAWICEQLRNHIHDGILEIDPHPGRSYGNTMNVALNLAVIPELAHGEDNDLAQEHFDALGVWEADSLQPFGSPALVADLATAGFTLMRSAMEYVEAFTRLILLNKPAAPTAPNSLLGMFQINPGQTEPLPTRRGPAIGRCSAGILRACPDSSPTRSGQAVHGRWLLPVLRCRWCFMGQHSEAAPRTLESHLTHIYTNLGVSSRVQLAQQADRHA